MFLQRNLIETNKLLNPFIILFVLINLLLFIITRNVVLNITFSIGSFLNLVLFAYSEHYLSKNMTYDRMKGMLIRLNLQKYFIYTVIFALVACFFEVYVIGALIGAHSVKLCIYINEFMKRGES